MKKLFFAIVAVAAIMFTACNNTPKNVTTSDSPKCDTANIESSKVINIDTVYSVQDTVSVAESNVQETSIKVEEKTKEVDTKTVETEKIAKKKDTGKASNAPAPNASSNNPVKEEKPSIVGTWVMQVIDFYNLDDEKTKSYTSEDASWEFTDSMLIIYDEDDYMNCKPLPYTLTDKQLKVKDITLTFTVLQLTANKLVLRSSEFNEAYQIFTFSRK